jgi:hypothetical protein
MSEKDVKNVEVEDSAVEEATKEDSNAQLVEAPKVSKLALVKAYAKAAWKPFVVGAITGLAAAALMSKKSNNEPEEVEDQEEGANETEND